MLWRLRHGEVDGIKPKVAVLMIGTNNTSHRREEPQRTTAGIRAVLDELRSRLPETKILLLGVFPRDAEPGTPMRRINRKVNEIISGYADNERIFYQEIYNEFLTGDGKLSKEIMPDLLHPNERGYQTWAEAIEPKLAELLQ